MAAKRVRFAAADTEHVPTTERHADGADNGTRRRRRRRRLNVDLGAGVGDSDEAGVGRLAGAATARDNDDDTDDEGVAPKPLQTEDIEGQEEGSSGVDADMGVKITPFNLREEMEEGYFDADGTYVFQRDLEADGRDAWADALDWQQDVYRAASEPAAVADAADACRRPIRRTAPPAASDSSSIDALSMPELRDRLLLYMQPGESVLRAIRRHGGVRSRRGGRARDAKPPDGDRQALLLLTEVADRLLMLGDVDAYDYTWERLRFLQTTEGRAAQEVIDREREGQSDADNSDADAGAKVARTEAGGDAQTASEQRAAPASPSAVRQADADVQWEYRWSGATDVYGPWTTQQMLAWRDAGYFSAGSAEARRVGDAQAPFYAIQRIDFDLYT